MFLVNVMSSADGLPTVLDYFLLIENVIVFFKSEIKGDCSDSDTGFLVDYYIKFSNMCLTAQVSYVKGNNCYKLEVLPKGCLPAFFQDTKKITLIRKSHFF